MPTRERLESALRNAHQAGDTQAAKKLANALKAGQFDSAEPGIPAPVTPQGNVEPQTDTQQPRYVDPETGTMAARASDVLPGEVPTVGGDEGENQTQQKQSLIESIKNVPLEAMAAVNRGAADIANFLTTDQINAWRQVFGKEPNVRDLTEIVGLSSATEGNFMEEGLPRDVVRAAGEVVPAAVSGGAAMRQIASQVPKTVGPGTVWQNITRQMGATTPAADATLGAASGGGGEVGEAVGGDVGRAVGTMVAPMGVAAASRGIPARAPKGATRDPAQVQKMRGVDSEAETGVDLFPAQRSLDPAQLRAQRFLPELTPATQKASSALAKQNKQASRAVDEFVTEIAPDESLVQGPERFRSAAQRALENKRAVRSEQSSPFYQEAFRKGADVDLKPVRETMSRIAQDYPESGTVSKALRRIGGYLKGDPSLKVLHGAKMEIDDMLASVGQDSLGNTAKRELRKVKETLLNQMEEASPFYRGGRLAHEAASPPVTKLEESIIGKIADIDDTQLKNISRRIFDPSETNKSVVKNAKQVIDDVDPDAWNMLLRSEVERRIGSIKPEVGVSFENIPSKLKNAIFGSGKNREALLSGMSPQQRKNAELLEDALTRAGLGRPGGSETTGRQQFIKDLDKGIVSTVRNFLRNPIDESVSFGESTAFDKRARAMADVLFDPAYAPEARKALKDPSGKSLGFLFYQALDQQGRDQGSQGPNQPQNTEQ